MTRLGIGFLGEPEVSKMIDIAQYAESLNYESVWVAETRFTRDGFVPTAAIAAKTKSIKLGTGVVNVYTRNPVLLAISYTTLDELSDGRALFGIGPGSPLILDAQGYAFKKPISRLKEYVHVARRLIAGEEVTYKGEFVNIKNVQIETKPFRDKIPVYFGVTGPKAMETAGEIADGVLMNGFLSCEYVQRSMKRLEVGANRANRSIEEIDLNIGLVVSVDEDSELARSAVRPYIANYFHRFPNVTKESGYSESYIKSVIEAIETAGLEAGAKLITEKVIDDLVVAGSPDHARRRIREYRQAGADCPVLYMVGSTKKSVLSKLKGA